MLSPGDLFNTHRPNASEPSESDDAPEDLGFGTKVAEESRVRLLNRDGSFNVERRGFPFFKHLNLHHALLEMSWLKFIGTVFLVYVGLNAVFAAALLLAGPEMLDGAEAGNLWERFDEVFFFSVQTFTTVGYGHLTPATMTANVLSAVIAFAGLLSFALAAGLVFARFAQPNPQIAFSRRAIIGPYRGIEAFKFRIANQNRSQLVEVEAKVVVRLTEKEGGRRSTEFYRLPLERDKVSFFPLHWTVVHPIDEDSPIHGFTAGDFRMKEAEFLILLTAMDEASSQRVHTRSSYHYDEVICCARFSDLLERTADGHVQIDLRKLHEYDRMEPGKE